MSGLLSGTSIIQKYWPHLEVMQPPRIWIYIILLSIFSRNLHQMNPQCRSAHPQSGVGLHNKFYFPQILSSGFIAAISHHNHSILPVENYCQSSSPTFLFPCLSVPGGGRSTRPSWFSSASPSALRSSKKF